MAHPAGRKCYVVNWPSVARRCRSRWACVADTYLRELRGLAFGSDPAIASAADEVMVRQAGTFIVRLERPLRRHPVCGDGRGTLPKARPCGAQESSGRPHPEAQGLVETQNGAIGLPSPQADNDFSAQIPDIPLALSGPEAGDISSEHERLGLHRDLRSRASALEESPHRLGLPEHLIAAGNRQLALTLAGQGTTDHQEAVTQGHKDHDDGWGVGIACHRPPVSQAHCRAEVLGLGPDQPANFPGRSRATPSAPD